MLSLKPDLVIAETTTGPEEAVDQIRAAGVRCCSSRRHGPGRRGHAHPAVAGALGVPAAGEELTRRSEQRIAAVRADVPRQERPRVAFLYLRGSASVYLIGGEDSVPAR